MFNDGGRQNVAIIVALSKNWIPVRLAEERLKRIQARHPEIEIQHARVLETVGIPECDFGSVALLWIEKKDKRFFRSFWGGNHG